MEGGWKEDGQRRMDKGGWTKDKGGKTKDKVDLGVEGWSRSAGDRASPGGRARTEGEAALHRLGASLGLRIVRDGTVDKAGRFSLKPSQGEVLVSKSGLGFRF